MKKTISKKTRDEAILLCALHASNWMTSEPEDFEGLVSHDAFGLAERAELAAWCLSGFAPGVSWGEAECLLREGWCPGDKLTSLEVEVIAPDLACSRIEPAAPDLEFREVMPAEPMVDDDDDDYEVVEKTPGSLLDDAHSFATPDEDPSTNRNVAELAAGLRFADTVSHVLPIDEEADAAAARGLAEYLSHQESVKLDKGAAGHVSVADETRRMLPDGHAVDCPIPSTDHTGECPR